MWVHGDLKERLGIQHRRDIKKSAKSDIEQTPMFHRPHFRSESEISSFQPETDRGTPPRSPATDSNRSSPMVRPSPLAAPPISIEDDTVTPRQQMSSSPAWRGSYYSASNIPVPSPTPGGDPPMSSVSHEPLTTATYAAASQTSNTLQIPALRNRPSPTHTPEAYEMRVREQASPPQPLPSDDDSATPTGGRHHHLHAATEDSYATAYDGFVDEDVSHHHPDRGLSATSRSYEEDSWRDSTYSTGSGPTVL